MKRSLDIELTRRCNLRCEYCFVGWSRDWHTDMPLATALNVVSEGAGLFPMLHITGGEPFAYSSLFQVIEAGLEHGYEEILINSNGTMLTPEIVDRLASYGGRLAISVSLDGPATTHDAARGEGRFQTALSGLSALLKRGVRASVMTVITPVVLADL
ncbi:MAG TPA: radical SAM protein, partial [Polyangiaceae bacterium]|nr:radical SAM protein [Polyangiaceae bacterium]